MNVYQAVQSLPALAQTTYDATPAAPPAGPYAVVSLLTEGINRQLFTDGGRPSAIKELTVLVTLWGIEGAALADLMPLWAQVKRLQGQITSHPGLASLHGVLPGPAIPPMLDRPAARPMAAVRFVLTYRE